MAVTNIDGPLPQLDYAPSWTITVEADVGATKITQLNVYGYTPTPPEDVAPEPFIPQFSYGAS